MKSDQSCLPVSVCVKNHVRPATAAATAATPSNIGFAAINPVNDVHPVESLPARVDAKPPAFSAIPPKPVAAVLIALPPSPNLPAREAKPPATSLNVWPISMPFWSVLPMPVVSPPNATVPKTTLVAMSCCSGVRDLYQSLTPSSAGVTFSSKVVPSSSAFSLKGMAASPASAIFWFSSASLDTSRQCCRKGHRVSA